jgi:hypothetical protein
MKTRRMLVAAIALIGVVALTSGCSSEQTTRTTTQATASNPEGYSTPQPPPAQTTTTTTTNSNEPDSVLGATFHLVGTIILLPFRIIGLIV